MMQNGQLKDKILFKPLRKSLINEGVRMMVRGKIAMMKNAYT
jgi:hypothetical protein